MKIAFYKGKRNGFEHLLSILVRLVDHGQYSHAELVFNSNLCASASWPDGGVRFKNINLLAEHWDIIEIPFFDEAAAKAWFKNKSGAGYDIAGLLRFGLPWLRTSQSRWFCSEAIAAAIGIKEPWRYGPNGLFSLMQTIKEGALLNQH